MKYFLILLLISFTYTSCNYQDKETINYLTISPSDSEITVVINSLLKLEFDDSNTKNLCKPILVLDTMDDKRLYLLESCMAFQKDSTNVRYIGKNTFSQQDSLFSVWQIENAKPYKIQLNFNGARLTKLKDLESQKSYPSYYNNGCEIYRLTRPLFSVDKKTALIELMTFDNSGAGGTVIVMTKKKDKWNVKTQFSCWAVCR